ncbi:MAG: FecR domain-containing protein [Polyangiaceae bacterium]
MKKPCAGELLAAWAAQGAGATPEASLHLHLEACSGCAEEHRALLEMRDALAALPARRTPPARVDAIRFRITAAARRTAAVRGEAAPAAPPARGSFRLRTFALLAAALVTVFAVLVAWPRPRTPVASVELAEGARGHLAQPGADERYALLDGVARFHVRRLVQGESFRVSVGDDTVTVRGTVFEVTAEDGGIAAVEVSEGSVLLTLADGWSRHLEAGDSWRRAEPGHEQHA